MNSLQITCPHCNRIFQIDSSVGGQAFACPYCAAPIVAVVEPPISAANSPLERPVEPPVKSSSPTNPPAVPEPLPPPSDGAPIEPRDDASQAIVISTEDGGQATLYEPPRTASSGSRQRTLRPLSARERESRRFMKNMIVWVLCAIVLVVVLIAFLIQGSL